MILSDIYATIYQFIVSYPIIAAIVGVVLLVFLWQKPWEFLRITILVLIIAAAGYYFALLTMSADYGSDQKRAITTEREQQLEAN
ncbi:MULTISPECIES: hypothetical protein [Desulfosediminicola]|uniref:hypothetical protein n=1 Tax=Desulfosediminicola TaxID=2886823 RepID=UPI0010AC837D|nr:hypothetical protein [Desulfosediminicola ganghwensis]